MNISFIDRYRYFIYRGDCDMRKGYDGLSGLVTNELKMDPLMGDVFIFFSRSHNRVKILHWQGDGFAIYSKRLEKGTFEIIKLKVNSPSIEISADQLQFIMSGITLSSIKKRVRYEHHFVDKTSVESGVSASM
jgi:transposase